jgi:hypothetical protein
MARMVRHLKQLETTVEQCEDSKSNDIANNNDKNVAEKLASMRRKDVDALKSSNQKQLTISIELHVSTKLSKDLNGKPLYRLGHRLPSSEQNSLGSSPYYKGKYEDTTKKTFETRRSSHFLRRISSSSG